MAVVNFDDDIRGLKNLVKGNVRSASRFAEELEELTHLIVYKQFREGASISFDDLAKLADNEPLEFPTHTAKKVIAWKIAEREGELEFDAEFDGNATLYRHRHDDCDEIMTITSDCVFKFMTGMDSNGTLQSRTMVKGDVIIIKATVDHQIINMTSKKGCIHTKLIKR